MRGYDVTELMRGASFVDVVFLLQRGRLPSAAERRLLDAILVAVSDHGAGAPSCAAARLVASGNRQSISAAIAAGILAVGNEHGGAGEICMEMIAAGLARGSSVEESARLTWDDLRAAGQRAPGLGHRVHSTDPRTAVLFALQRELGIPCRGAEFMTALAEVAAAAGKRLPVNVDGALAAVLHDLGFGPDAGKLIFLIGRVAGLAAEVAEEREREKPMRIKFQVEYDGVAPRALGDE